MWLHDHDFQPAVVESRARSDQQPVAVLSAVGDRDQHRAVFVSAAHRSSACRSAPCSACSSIVLKLRVRQRAAPTETALGEARGNHGIDTDAGDVEEEAVVHLAGVDLHGPSRRRHLQRGAQGRTAPRDPRQARCPNPAGTIASAVPVCTSDDATSLIVPSPPHATTSLQPAATASRANVRASPRGGGLAHRGIDAVLAEDAASERPRAGLSHARGVRILKAD